MKQLFVGSCVCTGDVKLAFTMPGVLPEVTHIIEKKEITKEPVKKKLYKAPEIAFRRRRR